MVTTDETKTNHDDLLWRQLKTIPAFRALLRAVEARFYQQIDLPEPVLDMGCGDGHFAQVTFDHKLTVGLDPWWGPLNKARRSEMYELVLQGMGNQMPFPDETFSSAISNSVLEHIPDIQPVLNEISRVLKPGGKLVITMPSHLFTQNLGGAALLQPVGLADPYRNFFNFVSRHAHTDSAEIWASRLAQAGFVVERWQYYFSTGALRALEVGHVQGLPSAVMHFLTGHWIVGPWKSSLRRTEQWVRPFFEEPFPDEGAYVLFIARKVTNGPIQATLPPARPFSQEEFEQVGEFASLQVAEEESPLTIDYSPLAIDNSPPPLLPIDTLPSSPESPISNLQSPNLPISRFLTGFLLAISLICALVGQSILSSNPPLPSDGLWWYGYSLIALLTAVWQARGVGSIRLPAWRLPRISEIPRKRWLYVAGLAASWLAQRQVADSAAPSPTLALLFWLAGIGMAFYALYDVPTADGRPPTADAPESARYRVQVTRFSLIVSIALFVTALFLRFAGLGSHPFILNGTEASIGLDIVNVSNPFATGWLTNPTLPYVLMKIPLAIFGRSVFGIRFLSPIVGALTVVATYWIGKRLWGEEVGLVSAVLLLGSHFHLHYSRLGVTNIWDPLATLLALGLIGIAWREEVNSEQLTVNSRETNRLRWLLAGTAVGLNVYLFTSSHLLPIMLVVLFGLALLFQREALFRQAHHILLAAALALVVFLPQWLYYNNHPTVFMERANNLGISDSQSGWMSAESARTGQSEGEILQQQTLKAALAFNYSLDTSPSYRPQIPLLTFGPALFLILGVFLAIFHFRQFRYQLLLVWLVVTVIFAGVLLIEPPSSHRLVIVTPALALLAAVGMVEIGRLLLGTAPSHSLTAYFLPILLVLAVLFALNDVAFYFGRYRTQYTFADRNTEIADAMADYLNELGPDWTGYFYGPPSMYIGFPTIPFLVPDYQAGVHLFDVITPDEKLPVASTPNQVFIFLPERAGELEAVKTAYPGGIEKAVSGFYANPLFIVYEVRP